MAKTRHRFLSLLLAAILVLCMVPTMAFAAKGDAPTPTSVIADIDKIGEVTADNLANTTNGLVNTARTNYNKLTDAQKAEVTNYSILTDAEGKVAALAPTVAATIAAFDYSGNDLAFVKNDDALSPLGMLAPQAGSTCTIDGDNVVLHIVPKNTTTYVALYYGSIFDDSFKQDVKLTDGAYDITLPKTNCGKALPVAPLKADNGTTGAQYYMAIPAEAKITDSKIAADVDAKIAAIGEVTLASDAAITEARTKYDALTDAQKAFVTKLETLTAAEEALKALKDAQAPADASDALTVTNKLNMFKVVSATLETAADGSKSVVFALSGTSYHYLVKGTYEEASAIGNDKTKWIAGATNTDGKWEFRVPVAEGETVIPLVAVSQTYLDKFEAGSNPITRAFYPRQITLGAEAKTLLVEDYKASRELTVTNNVKMFKVASAALTTVGGPNSNGYAKNLDLVMGSDSFDKAFVGRASAATAEGAKTVAISDRNVSLTLMWMEQAGDLDSITDLTKEPVVIAFHSVSKDAWYDRQFTVSEKDGTLVIDEAPAEAPAAEEGPITKAVTESGAEVAYGYKDVAEANILTTTKAADVNKEAEKAEDLEILWQKDIQIPAGTTFPVTLTFAVDEKYAEKDIYVYHFNGTDWEVAGKGKGASVSAKFESLSPVALVAMNPAPAAPQTADASVTLWAMLFTAAAAVAVSTVSFRVKRREE